MKLLIFVDSRDRAHKLARNTNGWVIGFKRHIRDTEDLLVKFRHINEKNEVGGINTLIAGKDMIAGWRAPPGTIILFDGDTLLAWSMQEILQAKGRAHEAS